MFDLPASQRTADRLFDLFREAWTSLRSAPEYSGLFESVDEERAWGIESLEVIANYLTIEDPVSISPLDSELQMSEELGDITIRGILDRLDERPDGHLVITDYKTGSAPPERFALAAFFALKIYALLVRSRFGRTPAELRLMYLGNSTVYSIPVSDRVLDGMERQLQALATAIRRAMSRNDFPPDPLPYVTGAPSKTSAQPDSCLLTGIVRLYQLPSTKHQAPTTDYGYTPRTSLASATLLMPFIRAAVRRSTLCLMLYSMTSSKARIMISRSLLTISFSDQK